MNVANDWTPAGPMAEHRSVPAHDAAVTDVPPPALKAFGDRFSGRLFGPADAGYDDARTIWNGAIARRPGLIARCADARDATAAVRLALDHDLRTSVRGGGHGVAGLSLCDDGLVIDLSAMRGVRVEGERGEAHVQAGATLGELDRAAQAFGLAVPAGIVTHTGVAGLTLGGGIGRLTRKHGLTVDNLLEAEVVTANGELVRVSEHENPELLWGLRGGGGNFGVVTSFRFRAHPIGPIVVAGPILFPLERTAEVMDVYREWALDAPDALTTILNVRRAAAPWVPEPLQGLPVCIVIPCWCGPIEEGLAIVEPIRRLGPILDLCEPRPWLEHQQMFDGSVEPGWHYYWKSVELDALSPDAVDAIVQHTWSITSTRSYTIVFQLGGAMARVGDGDTGYGRRAAGYDVNVNSVWLPVERADASTHVGWVRSLFEDLEPMSRGVYVNFLGEEGRDRVRSAYGPETYDRLAGLKARFDPTNLFRSNQNIPPAV